MGLLMYNIKKAAAAFFCIVLIASVSACSNKTSEEKLAKINDRLELLDEYSEQHGTETGSGIRKYFETDTFRGIPYGSSKSDVKSTEKLILLTENTDSLSYSSTLYYNYEMTPIYWFNDTDQLYCGSYHMTTDISLDDIVTKMKATLTNLYGEPNSADYYDSSFNTIILFDDESIEDYVNSGQASYYAWFSYADIDVELKIEIDDTSQSPAKYFVSVYYISSYYSY